MRNVLVIRFGALGDLCLLAHTLGRAGTAAGAEGRRVTLVTKVAFAPLLGAARGVDEVLALEDGSLGGLVALARILRRRRWDTIVDAHGVLRAHVLLALLGRRPTARLAKDTADRLRLLAGGAPGERLARTMGDRFDELLPALAGDAHSAEILSDQPPFIHLRPVSAPGPVLGLAPGAQWATKRWPAAHFADLLDLHGENGGTARVFLGPREETWYAGSPLAEAAVRHGADIVRDRPLPEVARQLAACAAVVTNDSGLLHLSEAVGTPVIALFGPTVRAFGYFPRHGSSRALETDLDCRPCSRNGKRPCHRHDLACLTEISPAQVWDAVAPLLTGGST